MKNNDNKKLFIVIGCLFILVGLALLVGSVYVQTQYEKVDSTLTIHYGRKNRKTAYVEYYYNDVHYTDKGLSSFNGFTMKDGETYTVYINPEKPDQPHTVSYMFAIILIGFSTFVLLCVSKVKST
ncbi:MAG: hypothetical protein Q4D51_13570 [Eubacteriales bacterium]|nr:hypothetical protein [Eubacteriales bacterium]